MLKTYSHNLNKRHRTQVKKNITSKTEINPIQGGRFQGCSRMGWGGGGQKGPLLSKLSHISYVIETWHSYTLPKEDQKNT